MNWPIWASPPRRTPGKTHRRWPRIVAGLRPADRPLAPIVLVGAGRSLGTVPGMPPTHGRPGARSRPNLVVRSGSAVVPGASETALQLLLQLIGTGVTFRGEDTDESPAMREGCRRSRANAQAVEASSSAVDPLRFGSSCFPSGSLAPLVSLAIDHASARRFGRCPSRNDRTSSTGMRTVLRRPSEFSDFGMDSRPRGLHQGTLRSDSTSCTQALAGTWPSLRTSLLVAIETQQPAGIWSRPTAPAVAQQAHSCPRSRRGRTLSRCSLQTVCHAVLWSRHAAGRCISVAPAQECRAATVRSSASFRASGSRTAPTQRGRSALQASTRRIFAGLESAADWRRTAAAPR